jgi:hypothetical protein
MSYCTLPRLTFSGQFQADVSTVNNDVRHFENESFEARFQEPTAGSVLNGWWNPAGTGAFRLVGVRVNQALTAAGGDGTADSAHGLFVTGQEDRTAAKLVDLDPQFQTGSAIFGLRIVLTDGAREFMRGKFRWSAFRDIYFGRKANTAGSSSASAKFTSILTGVTWAPAAETSATLRALKAASEASSGRLGINLMTVGFSAGTTLGVLTGSIGPYRDGDPETFVSARRLTVANGGWATSLGIGYCDAEVSGEVLSLDLSNALPLQAGPGVAVRRVGSGPLFPAIVRTPDTVAGPGAPSPSVSAGVVEGQTVSAADLKLLDEIPYLNDGWLHDTSAVVDCPLDPEAATLITDHPIALVQPNADGTYVVAIRETIGGIWARADQFEFRMDAPVTGTATETACVRATQWGKPAQGWVVGFRLGPRQPGGGGGSSQDPHPPQAPIPDINFPAGQVTFSASVTTGADGWAANAITAADPGNPRGYLDGQIYQIAYRPAVSGASPPPPVEPIVLHVRDTYDPPAAPAWDTDIAPFMQQYGNLYPVMSKGLFGLADPAVARQHATLLAFAFERDIDDPNHMPVTRDLSAGKRQAVLAWLAQYTREQAPAGEPPAAPEAPASVAAVPSPAAAGPESGAVPEFAAVPDEVIRKMLADVGDGYDGKTHAVRDYLQSQLSQPTGDGS